MKRWGRIALGCGIVAIAPAYACLLDIPDVAAGDASTDGGTIIDVNVPEICPTLDASCIPAIPSDWQPVIVLDGGQCPSEFTASAFVANAQLAAGACACPKCTTTGFYSCDAGLSVSIDGPSCSSAYKVQAGVCENLSPSGYAEYVAYGVVGAVTCDPGSPTTASVTTDSLTACFPSSCTTDFCGAQGTKCITQAGIVACPAAFPSSSLVGNGAAANCAPCGCTLNPALCTGTLHVYSQINCFTPLGNASSSNTCTNIGGNGSSLVFNASLPPLPSCTEQQDAGIVTVSDARTICCAP